MANIATAKVVDYDPRQAGRTLSASISVRIEAETNDKLQEICFREGISKSALIKRLIRAYVEENANEG